jgi:flagellar motor switch protein FliN/FliY
MDDTRKLSIDALLAEEHVAARADDGAYGDAADVAPRRDLTRLMRRIPVQLTLEVGTARISLEDLMAIRADSVVELDTLAGEPLVIKVNGTAIGRAEVVVSGDNYGLKVLELSDLDLDSLQS